MSDNAWSNSGDKIKDAVEDALKTGDFSQLNDAISDTVTGALNHAKEKIIDNGVNREKTAPERKSAAGRAGAAQGVPEKKKAPPGAMAVRAVKAPFKRVGRVSGTLYQVFGGLGTGIMAILSLVFMGLALGFGGNFRVAFGIFLLLLLTFIVMINVGCRQKTRLKRAEKYRELSGYRHYINLEDLALHTNKSMKYIVKDVKKMLENGFFPEGHLDRQESCLMLDDKVYGEYLALEKQRQIHKREQQAAKNEDVRERERENPKEEREPLKNPELDAMIAEGREYISRLRGMNDNIPGEVISGKLFRLENLLKEIFDSLKDHPDQMPQMQKFMNYYLPTTIKLVGAYEEFDSLSVQGEDILEAKAEIEKTLDTINRAFGELLNKIFRETAYDVTTDAQVLKAMLAKEGLTGEMDKQAGGLDYE